MEFMRECPPADLVAVAEPRETADSDDPSRWSMEYEYGTRDTMGRPVPGCPPVPASYGGS